MQRGLIQVPKLIVRCCSGTLSATGRASVVLNHLRLSSSIADKMSFSTVERGCGNTLHYRIYYQRSDGTFLSPFHDIPLFADAQNGILNMVVEIPRWTNAKMEISKDEKLNPIKQDVKSSKLRFVKNIFPHKGYIWNYGAHPQTWEDPNVKFDETNTSGDNDPLDVCEIGQKVHERGAVIQVKLLGCMLLIDEGETDWKMICIDVNDPLASKLNDIGDVDREMPGFLRATYEWFKYYKVPDGKPENTVHWRGKCKDREFAMQVVHDTHEQWKKMTAQEAAPANLQRVSTTVERNPDNITPQEAAMVVSESPAPGPAAEVPGDVDKWYYVIPQ